jgi:hypothetical protein
MKRVLAAIWHSIRLPVWVFVAISAAIYGGYGVGVRRDLAKAALVDVRATGLYTETPAYPPDIYYIDGAGAEWTCPRWERKR